MMYRTPLTRASRITLPLYPTTNLIFGFVFLTDPGDRLSLVPAYRYAESLFPLYGWGLMWLLIAGVMCTSLVARSLTLYRVRMIYEVALSVNMVVWGLWGLVVEVSAFKEPDVSILAGVLPLFVAVGCWASLTSLLWNEHDHAA